MSADFKVTRAHLKRAVERRDWDLLDKLLELSHALVNDNCLFTDTWGEWWGMLYECTAHQHLDGVSVLLKHGAGPELCAWGDGMGLSPVGLAEERGDTELIELLSGRVPASYTRRTDPLLPTAETARDRAVNRQAEIAEGTGLRFQVEALEED